MPLGDQTLPEAPTVNDQSQWAQLVARLYGVIRGEREQRAIERKCVQTLKDKGVIR